MRHQENWVLILNLTLTCHEVSISLKYPTFSQLSLLATVSAGVWESKELGQSWVRHLSRFPNFLVLAAVGSYMVLWLRFLHSLCLWVALIHLAVNKSQSWIRNFALHKRAHWTHVIFLDQKALSQPQLKKKKSFLISSLTDRVSVLLLIYKINVKPCVVLIWNQCNSTLSIFVNSAQAKFTLRCESRAWGAACFLLLQFSPSSTHELKLIPHFWTLTQPFVNYLEMF